MQRLRVGLRADLDELGELQPPWQLLEATAAGLQLGAVHLQHLARVQPSWTSLHRGAAEWGGLTCRPSSASHSCIITG